ncbi:hypothetical protein EJ05DRAFT_142624 [Pseudovirgaria hyperparasitica]|uniref:Histone-lysine N-methyltransferase, H3 lysine-36 specific n=1 Tax=Pseudovirgaria hyperparasitica TaxID=470096 RepID=A0A6A6VWD1_9PEZI|nr:uncharacterized protein EJ05DRAFT_142624 [Pseudovirgaria hyperparasitica]KAF2754475.1 hypothetical protein EJ05DRAFT_142624 [Pseudovirgaria hyperparasitica]
MSEDDGDRQSAQLEPELREMKIEEEGSPSPLRTDGHLQSPAGRQRSSTPNSDVAPTALKFASASLSPHKMEKELQSPATPAEQEETIGGEITLKLEPGKIPRLARTASQKIVPRPPPLYNDLPDKTQEAVSKFLVLSDCTYTPKYLGETEHALECDCPEEWDSATQMNFACGEDSDCINRATKMECLGECGCGTDCQNQRFQRKQYANVSVIQTEKKGYGLRANTDLREGDFIFEYIGEVINEGNFRRRMRQYDEEGIKHFYFMSLSRGEFVDATKRGNLGRFCNHSCNPNCYVDKWVIGDKLRMGIFAERKIRAGEELVFNYNVDRYGADPQPCYCGEPNCSGFIGGKTQTDDAPKLSNITIEALGILDGEDWDEATSKRPRKKKLGEADEEYVNNVQPKLLEESGVTKVMASLRQCKEKWIAVKLLGRLQRVEDERILSRVVKMHGYQIMKATLIQWMEDSNVILQVLDVLDSLPRITRNKIQDAKIEETVEKLATNEDERVKTRALALLDIWSKLEVAYRIPRVKRDPNAAPVKVERLDRRTNGRGRSRSRSRSPEPPKGPKGPSVPVGVPSGPKSSLPQRNFAAPTGPRASTFRRPPPPTLPLPPGWLSAIDPRGGRTYYYTQGGGETQWTRPTTAATQPQAPPPPISQERLHQQKLQDIIDGITANSTPKDKPLSTSATPSNATPRKDGKEKWRSLPEEKQMKIYKNTLHPHIKHYIDKYKQKLPRDDLKRYGKEISESMTKSDFKHKRVSDPHHLDDTQVKLVRKHIAQFFEKAATKHARREEERSKRKAPKQNDETKSNSTKPHDIPAAPSPFAALDHDGKDVELDDINDTPSGSVRSGSPGLKRKRPADNTPEEITAHNDIISPKRSKVDTPSPPPPPPTEDSTPTENGADVIETVAYHPGHISDPMASSSDLANCMKASPLDTLMQSPTQLATPPTTTNGSEHDSCEQNRHLPVVSGQ